MMSSSAHPSFPARPSTSIGGVAPFGSSTAEPMYSIKHDAQKQMEKLIREQQEEINEAVS